MAEIIDELLKWDEEGRRVRFFPVRHYSPASARMLAQWARVLKPREILIEGPSDYNPRIEEMYLEHKLPIALFTYLRYSDNTRASAFYPFCEYSPEWQALQVAREIGSPAKFIDLPFSAMARTERTHRYQDRVFKEHNYIGALCDKLQVEDFDEVWDVLFELDSDLTLETYMPRALHFVYQLRYMGGPPKDEDVAREAFMAEQIREALARHDDGEILVVTGGFHTPALFARLNGIPLDDLFWQDEVVPSDEEAAQLIAQMPEPQPEEDPDAPAPEPVELVDRGITLTPFTYDRVDKISGYASGVHGPEFYRYVFETRNKGEVIDGEPLLYEVIRRLRARGQICSTSDAIAIETTAWALASMRGRREVWRYDLLDALSAAVIKEEMAGVYQHPVLSIARDVFKGDRRGLIGEGTDLPPLVRNTRRELEENDLTPQQEPRRVTLDLLEDSDRTKSIILHRCKCLGISGFTYLEGTDLSKRDDMARPHEVWEIHWSPDYEGTLIENAVYGADLAEASASQLLERARMIERDAEQAALLVLDATMMDLGESTDELFDMLRDIVRLDPDFFHLSKALDHLLYLFAFDEIVGAKQDDQVGDILGEAYNRSLFLFEGIGVVQDRDRELTEAIGTLYHVLQRCEGEPFADPDHFADVFARTGGDDTQMPLVRGAALGALYTMGRLELELVLATLRYFNDPMETGDFMVGLFSLAREAAQRDPRLLAAIDEMIMPMNDDRFLEVLPGFRLAFTFFTPREKHKLIDILFPGHLADSDRETQLPKVDPLAYEHAVELEQRVFATMARFGLPRPRVAAELPGDAADLILQPRVAPTEELPPVGAPPAAVDDDVVEAAAEAAEDIAEDLAEGVDVAAAREATEDGEGEGAEEMTPEISAAYALLINPDTGYDPQSFSKDERMKRWRMILGVGSEGLLPDLDEQWAQREQAVGFLYDREYGGRRNVRRGGGGQRGGQRGAGNEASQMSVPDWINEVHQLFPKRVIERLERDALDRYQIEELVTRPELLEKAEPSTTLLKAVLRTKHLMNEEVLQMARNLVRKVVEDLMEKLAREVQQPFVGAINRRRRSFMKIAKNFDADETIRRNLKHYDPEQKAIVIQDPFFFSRVKRNVDRWQVIIVVDESGSMMDSVIHSAVTASIFWGIRAIKSHLVIFDTEVVDLTADCSDPVETLMRVQLGGGTDIAKAMRYAHTLIENPRRTIVLLVTDFYEGGSVQSLLQTTKEMCESGVTLLGLAALDDTANPCYDKELAQRMVNLGASVGAMTPGELAAWVAEKVR